MTFRKAEERDIGRILEIYSEARDFMRKTGNALQWQGGYPDPSVVMRDIKDGYLYAALSGEDILGVFFFKVGDDPTYAKIYEGEWQSDSPYAVIHRVAVSREAHGMGVGMQIFDYCFDRYPNLRIDTHRDNKPMQSSLLKAGFKYCGIIYLASGDERLAYQKM